ncbi:hypothetical protein ACED51_04500 [Photobacterium swingsii]|uniref:hypothetical protein n=1 Tax=Photobacterium swingsii TaxID=680026 RepID=UPI00352D3D61
MVSSTHDAVNVAQGFLANMDWLVPAVLVPVAIGLRNIYKRMKVDMTLTLKLSTKKDAEQ